MSTRGKRVLSELEGICLGLVRKHDPCTAYQVRSKLKEAPSSHWQASAGSVYPLLNRLEDEGLLASTTDSNDGRGRKLLSISRTGRVALKKWLLAGASQEHVSSVTDPIRSRTFFLDLLNPSQRSNYVDALIGEMERYLAETRAHLGKISEAEEPFNYLGSLGAVNITESRLAWLRMVRKRLIKP